MTSDIHHNDSGKLLNRSETIKRQLERDAAKHFLRLYEQMFATPMRNIWHNEPTKPDISCHLNGQPLDLEIAHLYASASEAKLLTEEITEQVQTRSELASSHKKPGNKQQELLRYLSELVEMDSTQQLITALGHILSSKAKKHYDSQRVWLVIRNASPVWNADHFRAVLPQLARRFSHTSHPFEQIWLLPEFDGSQAPLLIN